MAAARRINLNRLLSLSSSTNPNSRTRIVEVTAVRSEHTDRIIKTATEILEEMINKEAIKKQEKEETMNQEDDEEEDGGGGEYVNKESGEIGGPRGPEPTRFGDWERNGRCSDF